MEDYMRGWDKVVKMMAKVYPNQNDIPLKHPTARKLLLSAYHYFQDPSTSQSVTNNRQIYHRGRS
ncbi:hypothetical protein BDV10DRAFT_41686 [Aspergillus recurvatus]